MELESLVEGAGASPARPARTFLAGVSVGAASTLLCLALLLPKAPPAPPAFAPLHPLQLAEQSDDGRRLLLLNADLGLGSVQVPWQKTVTGGTSANSSWSAMPNLALPKVSCKKIVEPASLCAGCIPNDMDDSQVVAWAMNLLTEEDSRMKLIGVSQTFGNADHASADLSLKRLMEGKGWELTRIGKYRTWTTTSNGKDFALDFPNGASGGAVIDYGVPMRKFVDLDSKLVLLEEHLEYAKHSCLSSSVLHLRDHLMEAPRPVHLVATGPGTDLGCLVRNFGGPKLYAKIAAVYFLGGRRWGKGMKLCNEGNERCLSGLSDFNVRLNPIALEAFLESGLPPEKIILVPFELSGQWGNSVDAENFLQRGAVDHCDKPSREFFVNNLVLRAQWYDRIFHFGERIWLWDLVPFYKALVPSAIKCRQAKAAMVWCESKQGFKRFHGPGNQNASRNSCAGHAVIEEGSKKLPFRSMTTEAAQLWICTDDDDCREPGEAKKTPVTVCDEWSSDEARSAFIEEVMQKAFY